jgi:peptide/nickel transport system substrate-binding protein
MVAAMADDMGVTSTALTNAGVVDYDGDGQREYLYSETSTEATDLNLSLLVCSDSTQKTAVANKLAADLRQIGVNVEVKGLPWEEYLEALAAGNFDLYYGELRLTADFDLTPLLVTGGIHMDGFMDTTDALAQVVYDKDVRMSSDASLQPKVSGAPLSGSASVSGKISTGFSR